jgi:hypothetical protein
MFVGESESRGVFVNDALVGPSTPQPGRRICPHHVHSTAKPCVHVRIRTKAKRKQLHLQGNGLLKKFEYS